MKLERKEDMCQLKKEIICYLFSKMERKNQNKWWHYQGEFTYENKDYTLECECRYDNQMFTYRNLHIEHKQQIIDLH